MQSEKILIMLLPFWDPQIPPLGPACLKSYLQPHGFSVKTIDANLELQFRNLYDAYFNALKRMVPKEKQGNIYNIGNQVLRNHLTAHIHSTDASRFFDLLKLLFHNTFFCELNDDGAKELDEIIHDFYQSFDPYFLNIMKDEKPDVLGLSVYGDTLGPSMRAFTLTRKHFPDVKTIMGGGIFADQLAPGSPELDYFVEKTADSIDKIVIGEGEALMLRYLKGEMEDDKRVIGIADIADGPLDIAAVNVPDFSDFDLGFYPHLAFYGARSCPCQCKFCSETVNWGKYRKKSTAQTAEGFIELHRRYGYQLFLMTDSTLNPIISKLSKDLIESQQSIYWDGFLRADSHVCNTENTMLWRKGGFYRAKLGLESGSQKVLDLMNKGITLRHSQEALASLAYAGIKTTTFWLFGYPGETEDDFQQTLDFVEMCKDNIYEADCNAFNYYLTGQANSEEWLKNNKGVLLYPDWARDMLITRTWVLEGEPTREQAYQRLNRFIAHCNRLGIPNPYSLSDVVKADERWKRLHKNAVPSLVLLKDKDHFVDENLHVKEYSAASQPNLNDEDFDF